MGTTTPGPVKGWKEIPLTRGKVALVDLDDLEMVSGNKWCAMKGRNGAYYATSKDSILMHRHILGLSRGDRRVVDHVNGDGLDNRRANLRVCESKENLRNTGRSKRNKSGFKGVYFDKHRGRWAAAICINNKRIALGRFDSASEAALAYDQAAVAHHGEFAWTNSL